MVSCRVVCTRINLYATHCQDSRTYDIKKFKAEVRKESASATPQQIFPPTDPCDECVAEAEDFCGTFIAGPVCGAIGAVVGAGIGTVGGPVGVVGGAVGGFLVGDIACSVFADESEGCENYSRSASGGCYDECGIEG